MKKIFAFVILAAMVVSHGCASNKPHYYIGSKPFFGRTYHDIWATDRGITRSTRWSRRILVVGNGGPTELHIVEVCWTLPGGPENPMIIDMRIPAHSVAYAIIFNGYSDPFVPEFHCGPQE